jgi:subtilisin family serine protease
MTGHLLKKILKLFFTLILILCVHSGQSQTFRNGIRQGMVKVKFTAPMSETVSKMKISAGSSGLATGIQKFDATANKVGARNMYRLFPYDAKHENNLRRHGLHLWYVVEIDEDVDPRSAAYQLKQLGEIEAAEVEREKIIAPYEVQEYKPSQISTLDSQPYNDPYLKDQWHYNNTSQSGFGDADINLYKAWESISGANEIIVSVHDEGVDVKHEDLKSNIWINTSEIPNNGIDDDVNGYIDDVNGFNFAKNKGAVDPQHHGTHVAGTIAAVNNNGKGVCGVAGGDGSGNGVRIMSMQILGGGLIERSYVYAANNGAVISQNSWGYVTDGYFDQSVLDAINYFIAEAGNYEGSPMRGGIVIFASGNTNSDRAWYPGRYESIMSVGAIGPEWKKAAYSNFGTWVDISAPGGDQINYSGINGVLSTIPGNKYAYMQGTSMACPHVSGIAALVLANRTKQFTPAELWSSLQTGVVTIDPYNEEFVGKLGSGAIDAALAIKSDEKIAPATVSDLIIDGIAQEFATLSWTVPADGDDERPVSFDVYYHTQPLTGNNLSSAEKATVRNLQDAGTKINYEVSGLLGVTTYYFGVTSTDRWGNVSLLSNTVSASTNEGPSISVTPLLIDLEIDASQATSKSATLEIQNNAVGILRWNSFMRHRSNTAAFSTSGIHYPRVTGAGLKGQQNIGRTNARALKVLKPEIASATSFNSIEKSFSDYATNIVGETNISIPNSAAGRFYVSEEDGFNLTDVAMYLKHDAALGPVVVEVYKGNSPTRENLLYAQEYNSYTTEEVWASITLDEQIYFEHGSTFWLAFHIPAGNLYPLGIGYESASENSTQCFMSFNVGATWQPLEEALNDKQFAWVMSAGSYNQFLGTYISLDPASGDVNGNSQTTVTLTADASVLVNGNYSANLVIASNDPAQRELRVPVNVVVSGHQPDVRYVDIADFGSVFVGENKTLDIELDNQGFGSLSQISAVVNGDGFEIESAPYSLAAREKGVLRIKFSPSSAGNKNATVTISNDLHSYSIPVFGVGAETSKINVTPEVQSFTDLIIGEVINAQITVENTGAYPLKYFIPGFDDKGISSNWPTGYHRYGYKLRSNRDTESNPIQYGFQDISSTGTDITSSLIKDDAYVGVDMGFSFPYYGKQQSKIYIAQKGFTVFDNAVRPINTPILNNSYGPAGYISPLGTWLTYIAEGKIFYQVEADRVIIQYDNVTDGFAGYLTAQMVLHANGDIRFYYENMGYEEWSQSYLNILIEDIDKSDGILIHDYMRPVQLYSGLAIGLDYPGPNVIESISNGSGILAPGSSAQIDVTLNTESLSEGNFNRYINIVSNDPTAKQKLALVQLNLTNGGIAQPTLSATEIDFGNVFQGATRAETFIIKNTGTADAAITSIELQNDAFNLTGNATAVIKPGFFEKFVVSIPTSVITALSDQATIHYADGSNQVISITGNVVAPPAIQVNLSAINETLSYGEKKIIPLAIQNTGTANLEFTAVGKHWQYFESSSAPSSITYEAQKENTGGVYQWIDIRKSGVHLPFASDPGDENEYWRTITLPFEFEYFGEKYTELKAGENGIVSFEVAPPMMLFTDSIPSPAYEGAHIMPYWVVSGFDTYHYKAEDVGIFYQVFPEKIVITWSYMINYFGGMGDPISAQLILYENGMIRFQYKVEDGGSDQTSNATIIGLQQNGGSGIMISDRLALDHGKGLVWTILPAKKFTVAPNTTFNGEIVLDATNTYSGNYSSSMRIMTNVPGSELLEKPVNLNITGTTDLSVPDSVEFGSKIIAFEGGMPVAYSQEIQIVNSGTTALDVTWIESASGGSQPLSLQVYTLIDGWFGPSWEWVDIAQLFSPWSWPTPVYEIMPGDQLKARAVFYPSSTGDFAEEIILTTTAGEKRIVLTGTGIEAPSLEIAMDQINVAFNLPAETENRSIAFNNVNGKSDLVYEIQISYDRAIPARVTEPLTASSAFSLKAVDASPGSGIRPMGTYNRTIMHTERNTPDNHVGTDGSAPFTVATKFNAGNKGFNLSHVESWFRTESFAEGVIEVEIRAGGTSVTKSATVNQTSVPFVGSGEDLAGNWIQLPLSETVFIYPNEDFYVLITYPFGIHFPQGIVRNEPTVPDQYLYFEDGAWNDLQAEDGFLTSAWLMYAAEESELESSWISIVSPLEGTLEPGATSSIDVKIDGAFASRGDQLATVVVTTNDPEQEVTNIPVKLHMNEAPKFGETNDIIIAENTTVTVTIPVVDVEGHAISISPVGDYDYVSSEFSEGVLSVTIAPAFGAAGNYTYTFTASDEHNAQSSLTLNVTIEHSNQAPVFIGDDEPLSLDATGDLTEYGISNYFEDPDGDAISFNVASSNNELLEVFASADKFLLKPLSAGELTLTFHVTDANNATTIKTIQVTVNVVLGITENVNAYAMRVYPNPAEEQVTVHFANDWRGAKEIQITDMSGRVKKTTRCNNDSCVIDLSELSAGLYILHASSGSEKNTTKLILR